MEQIVDLEKHFFRYEGLVFPLDDFTGNKAVHDKPTIERVPEKVRQSFCMHVQPLFFQSLCNLDMGHIGVSFP